MRLQMKTYSGWSVLGLILVAALSACKGESPTEPSGGGGSGTIQPPRNPVVTLEASNTNPEAGSIVTITARVTDGGNPVPAGTAVQFQATGGVFLDTNSPFTVRITEGNTGVATAQFTSTAVGPIVIRAIVPNAEQRTVTLNFREGPNVIRITLSDPNPLMGGSVTVTATITRNGLPVPDGTSVEFTTTLGTFNESRATSAVVTTTGGVATATLTSPNPGLASITVRVGDVQAAAQINFRESTSLIVTAINPTRGNPAGGEIITITGRNFTSPVRVLFGDQAATVVSQTPTELRVMTPRINLGATEGSRAVTITVISAAGTAAEQRVVVATPFIFEIQILTPVVYHISPASGPNEGNTRITIFGEGFQAPSRVFFGTGGGQGAPLTDQVELEVLQVSFNQIIAMTPPALGLGTTLRNTQVVVRVLNVASNKDNVLINGFRYGPVMAITGASNTTGSALGGTQVTIFGWGFDDPVAVSLAGIGAQVIRVSGTEIVVRSSPLQSPCTDLSGPISVTNIEDGSSAIAEDLEFNYIGVFPLIAGVSSATFNPGSTVTVSVANPGLGFVRFTLKGQTLIPSPSVSTVGTGVGTFAFTIPATFVLDKKPCTTAAGATGVQEVPTEAPLNFLNVTTNCDAKPLNITVIPADTSCVAPPPPTITAFNPAAGVAGTQVTISGTNFTTNSTVRFGGVPATIFVVDNPTQITATVPATAQTGSITVTTPNGSANSATPFVVPNPTVLNVAPPAGPSTGNTTVTITGTNFGTGATVRFDTTPATNVTVINSSTITATTPAHAPGAVNVTVTNANGLSGTQPGGFTYTPPPTVTGVAPNSGPAAGGTPVTITGTNFVAGATVSFGGTAASGVVVVNSTTITATTPAHLPGAVTVVVTNPDGQSGSLAGGFTYL